MSEPASVGYFDHERPDVIAAVRGQSLEVLELGCANGNTGAALLANGTAARVDGVELDPQAASVAQQRLDLVVHGDVTRLTELGLRPPYDVILASDVLEHVADPWSVLRACGEMLAPGGELVASIPNVRFFRVVSDLLLRGRFEYQDSGVLDRTHLRFFTRSSIERLFEECGWEVPTITPAPVPERPYWKELLARAAGDLAAKQFIVVSRPRVNAASR